MIHEEIAGVAGGWFDRSYISKIAKVPGEHARKVSLELLHRISELDCVVVDEIDLMTLFEKQSAKAPTNTSSGASDDEGLDFHCCLGWLICSGEGQHFVVFG